MTSGMERRRTYLAHLKSVETFKGTARVVCFPVILIPREKVHVLIWMLLVIFVQAFVMYVSVVRISQSRIVECPISEESVEDDGFVDAVRKADVGKSSEHFTYVPMTPPQSLHRCMFCEEGSS